MLQLAAIRGLVEMKPVTVGVVNTLKATLESTTLFCRVRMEAALALASTAGTEYNGAPPPHGPKPGRVLRYCGGVGLRV